MDLVSIGRNQVEAKLFDSKGGVVKLYSSLTVEQQTELLKVYGMKKDMESQTLMALETIVKCFIDWNIGADGAVLPCTVDVLKKFSQRDLFAMLQECTGRRLLDAEGNVLSDDEIAKKVTSA